MNNFFTIITINYNNFDGLKNTVKSVLNQTFVDVEFIVIDGGSTDGSKAYIQAHSEQFNYWVSEPDKGVYHAMNKGLSKATGEFCLFLNSGDYFYDDLVLERFVKLLDTKSVLVYGLIKWEGNQKLWNPPAGIKDFELAFHSLIPHQAAFFKTSIIKKIGGYKEEFKVISDWGLMLEIIKKGFKAQKIDLIISICENQGISSTMENIISYERKKYLLKFSLFTLFRAYLYNFKNYFSKK